MSDNISTGNDGTKLGGGAKRCGKSSLRGGSQCENDDPVNQKGGYECNMFTKRGLKLGSHFWN